MTPEPIKSRPKGFALDRLHAMEPIGSGCGSVGRAVASDIRGPRFHYSHQQNLLNICLLSTVLKRQKYRKIGHQKYLFIHWRINPTMKITFTGYASVANLIKAQQF